MFLNKKQMEYKTPDEINSYFFSLSEEEQHEYNWFEELDPEIKKDCFAHTCWAVSKYKVTMRQYLPGVNLENLHFYKQKQNENEECLFVDINFKEYGGEETEFGKRHMILGRPYSLAEYKVEKQNDILKVTFTFDEESKLNFDIVKFCINKNKTV